MRNTKSQFFAASFFLLAVAALLTNGFSGIIFAQEEPDAYESLEPIGAALHEILSQYYEEPDLDDVVEGALTGMMNSLDEHSTFFSAELLQRLQEDTRGEFEGIGIHIRQSEDGWIMVYQPIEGSPAHRAGLMSNDLIIEVDGESTQGIGVAEAADRIKGARGTVVKLKVLRRYEDGSDDNEIMDLSIKRDRVPITSVKEKRVLPDGIGYVRLSDFKKTSGDELKDAIREMLDDGMRALVLDMRWNPGGLLSSSSEVCELFLPKNTLVTYTRGREVGGVVQEEMELLTKKTPVLPTDFPLVLLTSKATASSAEIVTGALQYHARALVIGEKTFGKGSVQTIIPLRVPAQSALKLTTALYYTPADVTIHKRGIFPDIEAPMTEAEMRGLYMQMLNSIAADPTNGNGQNHGSATGDEVSEDTIEDRGLLRAIEVLNEDPVFENLVKKYHKDPSETQIAEIKDDGLAENADSNNLEPAVQ